MKSIIVAALFLFAGLGAVSAQKKDDKIPVKTTTNATNKKEAKTIKTTTTTTTGMKKDGTPDMRLKENKAPKKTMVTGPLKKDSTPDMRYKANKMSGKKK